MIHTNVKSTGKYDYMSYEKAGVFYNIDETGFKEIIFVSIYTFVCFSIISGDDAVDKVEKEFDSNYSVNVPVTNNPKDEIVTSEKEETISGALMLKTLAVVLGNENLKDIL